mmetsp:Transcript_3719/g.9991  ORF Transcript_3719/g.9991 Transcript_3719/m.9991 type:complete len:85 (+) Transcript_3719:241-495(+)
MRFSAASAFRRQILVRCRSNVDSVTRGAVMAELRSQAQLRNGIRRAISAEASSLRYVNYLGTAAESSLLQGWECCVDEDNDDGT